MFYFPSFSYCYLFALAVFSPCVVHASDVRYSIENFGGNCRDCGFCDLINCILVLVEYHLGYLICIPRFTIMKLPKPLWL